MMDDEYYTFQQICDGVRNLLGQTVIYDLKNLVLEQKNTGLEIKTLHFKCEDHLSSYMVCRYNH